MYQDHFGINENPFSMAPDPYYLYLSDGHREALAHLLYGVKTSSGFVMLTGEVGTGKTTVAQALLQQLPDNVDLAYIVNPRMNEIELLATICDELEIEYPAGTTSLKLLFDSIGQCLIERYHNGRQVVLMIDEAQNLSADVLEQIRLLTNIESTTHKLLQVILVGQPELNERLSQKNLRQLAQRITARYNLEPLSRAETAAYVEHRLKVANVPTTLFSEAVLTEIFKRSKGTPRVINSLCDRCLLGAYSENKNVVERSTVKAAANEVVFTPSRFGANKMKTAQRATLLAGAGAIAILAATWGYSYGINGGKAETTAITPVASVSTPAALQETPSVTISTADPVAELVKDDMANDLSVMTPTTTNDHQADQTAEIAGETIIKPIETIATTPFASEETPVQESFEATTAESLPGFNANEIIEEKETPAVLTDLRPFFSGSKQSGSFETAFAGLLRLWGHDFQDLQGLKACRLAQNIGLKCLQMEGNLSAIWSINRPVIISMRDENGRTVDGIVTAIAPNLVDLQIGTENIRTDWDTLSRYWTRNFLTVWNPPPVATRTMRLGDKGADIVWLRRQLSTIFVDIDLEVSKDTFDEHLRHQIKRFQALSGISVDGVVGSSTLIKIATAIGDPRPPVIDAMMEG